MQPKADSKLHLRLNTDMSLTANKYCHGIGKTRAQQYVKLKMIIIIVSKSFHILQVFYASFEHCSMIFKLTNRVL